VFERGWDENPRTSGFDKFVGNEFGQLEAGPQGASQGWTRAIPPSPPLKHVASSDSASVALERAGHREGWNQVGGSNSASSGPPLDSTSAPIAQFLRACIVGFPELFGESRR
jgi:hypothetical protein